MNRSALRAGGIAAVFCLMGAVTAGCTLIGGSGGGSPASQTVTVVTHDSWVASQEILDAFEKQSGIKISVLKQGATRAR